MYFKVNIVNDVPYFVNSRIKKLNKIKNNPLFRSQFFITTQNIHICQSIDFLLLLKGKIQSDFSKDKLLQKF